ncbi:MAG TPA: TIGR03086 family protein [Nocardioides bacterium]|uniref:TIGR03086 family metal-binding protein n=1 Tax=uncultured Nocardioides sp. TaxID=198441 RepID=UPI000EC95E92|nr:TIGR03086 family metal-binding protein [uncultured Nocardioides sp.]HCB07683.1 TIGR03086 family protein [Nocardioides sp.]
MTRAPSPALSGAVELLERSLGYTRVLLVDVTPDQLDRSTPCAGWTLGQLLAHMEDALDAFTEAAVGRVEVDPVPPTETRVDALQEKACALLGAWAAPRPVSRDVAVGDLDLDGPLLVATAALEITLHGWDVGQATGRRTRIPDDLARGLLPLAQHVIDESDRGPRFADPRPTPPVAAADQRLLAWTGRVPPRMTEPLVGNRAEPPTRRGLAS